MNTILGRFLYSPECTCETDASTSSDSEQIDRGNFTQTLGSIEEVYRMGADSKVSIDQLHIHKSM